MVCNKDMLGHSYVSKLSREMTGGVTHSSTTKTLKAQQEPLKIQLL
jgi:hypothetical protein